MAGGAHRARHPCPVPAPLTHTPVRRGVPLRHDLRIPDAPDITGAAPDSRYAPYT